MAVLDYALTTLALVKAHLGISVSTYDTLLEGLIDDWTVTFQNLLGDRKIVNLPASDLTEYYDGPDPGLSKQRIFLRSYPIVSVTSVSYRSSLYDASAVWTAYTAGQDYIVETGKGSIYFPGGIPQGPEAIRVIYQGGFASAPKDLELACRKMVCKEFGKRKAQGRLNESVGGGSIGWSEDLPADVKAVLNHYRSFHV